MDGRLAGSFGEMGGLSRLAEARLAVSLAQLAFLLSSVCFEAEDDCILPDDWMECYESPGRD